MRGPDGEVLDVGWGWASWNTKTADPANEGHAECTSSRSLIVKRMMKRTVVMRNFDENINIISEPTSIKLRFDGVVGYHVSLTSTLGSLKVSSSSLGRIIYFCLYFISRRDCFCLFVSINQPLTKLRLILFFAQ
jgi:hypothetical protein